MVKTLGQFMTPSDLANFVASQLSPSDTIIDLAAGDGSLLRAAGHAYPRAKLLGYDIDDAMVKKANQIPNVAVSRKDGLRALIPSEFARSPTCVIGNPPFLPFGNAERKWIEKAFPNLGGKRGTERAEVHFLARALVVASKSGGRVVFVMPIGFADGDTYRNVRAALMEEYALIRCVEVIGNPFSETEARTVVIVVDTQKKSAQVTEISEFDVTTGHVSKVIDAALPPGSRLDARYHRALQRNGSHDSPQLKDLKVSVTRGLVSRKEAEERNVIALHTTHISKAASRGTIRARFKLSEEQLENQVIARKGDILLSRTGSRVSWAPVLLSEGAVPITDHVFRIRAAKEVRNLVIDSFRHPSFSGWLSGISKGVCATVITKRELLEMPVFAWETN